MPRTKTRGKRKRLVVVILIYTTKGENPRIRIIINIQIETKEGIFKIKALVDSGVEANYIKRKAVLLIGGSIINDKPTLLITPNEGKIYSYRDLILRLTITNIYRERRENDIQFILYNFELGEVDIILGYLQLTQVNLIISFGDNSWRYLLRRKYIKVLLAKDFVEATRAEPYLFLLITVLVYTSGRRLAAVYTTDIY